MIDNDLKVEELKNFLKQETIVYAKCLKENKRIQCTLDGYLEIIVGNAIIWRGKEVELAVERYNAIKTTK